jgi:hypothetical protein
MIALVASALGILFAILLVLMAKRKIAVCLHEAKVLDEAYATAAGEIIISYTCDSCGEAWQSAIWRDDPLGPPALGSDI